MKLVIALLLLISAASWAEDSSGTKSDQSEAVVALDCDTHPTGTICPSKTSTGGCKTLLCDSSVGREHSEKSTNSQK